MARKIKIKDYLGDEYQGSWNGKEYSSKFSDGKDLVRIYIDDEEVHVERKELDKIYAGDERLHLKMQANLLDEIMKQDDEFLKKVLSKVIGCGRLVNRKERNEIITILDNSTTFKAIEEKDYRY
ncbi:hypothetical protein [Konateibacter massiliensis]|uniref:hypothetical protein n=1 Tax=Konateibacter massiliensis TaxID=2002841 RepID=UPI000C161269|nr:hypothetical protein [Konateibacter massiliensis]